MSVSIQDVFKSVKIDRREEQPRVPLVRVNESTPIDFLSSLDSETWRASRFASAFLTLLANSSDLTSDSAEVVATITKQQIIDCIGTIDDLIDDELRKVFSDPEFRRLESNWRSVEQVVQSTDFSKNVVISLLDVSKEEAAEDLRLNAPDVAGSELFKKFYVAEYDQYGGRPYGALVSLFEFDSSPSDIEWLSTMGKIATAAHAPFIGSVKPEFFGCESMAEVNELRDIENHLDSSRYTQWNKLRTTEEAAYIGLVMPRVLVRPPYRSETQAWARTRPWSSTLHFNEVGRGAESGEAEDLWGSAATLFARNLIRSFEDTGWCQTIRGPRAGGLLEDLPFKEVVVNGETIRKAPVEITIPDFREYSLARSGLIPLIQKKGTNDAVFYSAQSIKKSFQFKDPKDSENSQLVTNLSYTFSITRIAHYLKCIMRDNIGSTANADAIRNQIDKWIARYTTAIVNPDDLTLRYYPFKAYALDVVEIPGKVGWYKCDLSVLPHVQFEGLDVDLRIDARLGA